jgi:hypothetical protein
MVDASCFREHDCLHLILDSYHRSFASLVQAAVDPGGIVCRFESTTKSEVNYYTCTELALKYSITVEKFFELNPTVNKACSNIQPDTDYCVKGCEWENTPRALSVLTHW